MTLFAICDTLHRRPMHALVSLMTCVLSQALKRQRKSGAAARKQRREELQKSNSLVGRRASGATDATMSPMSRSSSTSASQKSRLSPSLPSHYASHRDDEASTTEVPKRKSKLRKTKSPSKKKALDKYEALKLKYYKPKPKPKELWEQDLEAIIQVATASSPVCRITLLFH